MVRVLLVTIAIGDNYLKEYNTFFRWSQEQYASRHGYDFRVITEFLDQDVQDPTIISMQKFLVGCQSWSSEQDWIVFVDADILIHKDMPPIHTAIDFHHKIGIVDEITQPNSEARKRMLTFMNLYKSGTDYYEKCGFTLQTSYMLNSGVFVFEPQLHGQWLKDVYNKYRNLQINHPSKFHFEQAALGYELITQDRFVILSEIWNRFHMLHCIDDPMKLFLRIPSFLHFASNCHKDCRFNIFNTKYVGLYTNRKPSFGIRISK